MNDLNTFFDDNFFSDFDEMETSPQELEEIISELFQEEGYEHDAVDDEMFFDDYVLTDVYDIDL